MSRARLIGLTAVVFILGSGSAISQAAPHRPGICNQAAAASLGGKNRISDRRAKRLTGATIVRQIRPGQGVTMDYRRERITIETHPRTKKIVRAFCG